MQTLPAMLVHLTSSEQSGLVQWSSRRFLRLNCRHIMTKYGGEVVEKFMRLFNTWRFMLVSEDSEGILLYHPLCSRGQASLERASELPYYIWQLPVSPPQTTESLLEYSQNYILQQIAALAARAMPFSEKRHYMRELLSV